MRAASTYRAARRNVVRGGRQMLFERVSGESHKKPFEDMARYETPSKKERYNLRRTKKMYDRLETQEATSFTVPSDAVMKFTTPEGAIV